MPGMVASSAKVKPGEPGDAGTGGGASTKPGDADLLHVSRCGPQGAGSDRDRRAWCRTCQPTTSAAAPINCNVSYASDGCHDPELGMWDSSSDDADLDVSLGIFLVEQQHPQPELLRGWWRQVPSR